MTETSVTFSGAELESGHVLVGENGGLSLIYEVADSSAIPGLLRVATEHGALYLDPEKDYQIQV
jgi:hypothetical protein